MSPLRYTLLGDGSSDRVLIPILGWLFRQHVPSGTVLEQGQVADLGRLPDPPLRSDLEGRIETALDFFPCDVLFVHRDAEDREGYEERRNEVVEAVATAEIGTHTIPVIPVRMTEAWLLFDEEALRLAAGRPNNGPMIRLPAMNRLERIDAKQVLFDLLRTASGRTGRQARRFSAPAQRARLATLIDDFSPLRQFDSFRGLESDIESFCQMWAGEQGN